MYAFIIGKIESKNEDSFVVSAGGIGYDIMASINTITNIGNIGEVAKVLTYLQVREDALTLYGFATQEEKNMFLQLITVSGIGPKMAAGILSGISFKALSTAIALGDTVALSSAKGVGKKTAERIVLELKGKVGVISEAGMLDSQTFGVNLLTPQTEAVELLVTMGLTKLDATELVKRVSQNDDTTEQIVAKALRNMR